MYAIEIIASTAATTSMILPESPVLTFVSVVFLLVAVFVSVV